MSRRFGQIPLILWLNPDFATMTDAEKTALLYIWSGPHSTSAGVGRVPDAYAAADLEWPLEKWSKAREECRIRGFIERDNLTEEIWVRGYFDCNRPTNAPHRRAIKNQISSVRSGALKELAEAAYAEVETPASNEQPGAAQSATQNLNDASPQLKNIMAQKRWQNAA